MPKVLVLHYSANGHIEATAYAVAEGAREAGAQVAVKRVPETVPEKIARGAHFKLDQPAAIANVQELADYDAIVVARAEDLSGHCQRQFANCERRDPRPMGGVRDSGWGRTGPDSLKEFQDVIWINSHSGQRQYPF
jgi:menaquinone-dependent protoporphyrinogen IX oxidase